ncbi:septum formation family protein [Actinomadura sediminis]|uniref:Septum formation family protein n=1 Tax=Actinomadura sediminis TaxID=1038904 RepID=A0ABW3ELC7_9ACTN
MTTPPNADDVDRNRPWAPPDALAPPPSPEAPAPAASEPAESTPARRTDRTAVVALVTGLIGLVPLAVPFAVAALVRLRRGTRKGAALAVTALAASLAWTAAGTIVVVVVAPESTLERDAAGTITAGGTALFSDLREGDCFTGYRYDYATRIARPATVRAVPCAEVHTGEVIARVFQTFPLGIDEALSLCRGKTTYLRKSRVRTRLEPYIGLPRTSRGDVICAMHHAGGELTTPLADTVDTSLTAYQELTPGTCFDRRADKTIIPTVPCGEPHWSEVFATYELSLGGTYAPGTLPPRPADDVLRLGAERRCTAEARRMFKRVPPKPGVEIGAIWPTPEDWEIGILTVVCYLDVTGPGLVGPLTPQ